MPLESPTTTECPADVVFVELIEGRLDASMAADLERHMASCGACRALFEGLAPLPTEPTHPPGSPLPTAGSRAPLGETTAALNDRIARALLDDVAAVGATVAGTYRLSRRLGAGGMGAVYEAAHAGTGERVAVKLIHSRLFVRGSGAHRRFRREATAASAVESPHIVRVLDSGTDEASGDLYLVMEYLDGEDLQQLLKRVGPLPPDVALRIAVQALAGLAAAHAAGIVHRDVKPANLFLARGAGGEVTVKIVDFGIAKIVDPVSMPHTTGLTHSGGLLGSPLYMSPEQAQSSRDVDARSDLWSLGSTLYAALTGSAPHQGVASVGKLILAICGSPARPLGDLAPWVSPDVAEAVHRALAIDREARYPGASAMLETLRALAPGDVSLREDMLVGLTPEQRSGTFAPRPRPPSVPARRRFGPGWRVALAATAALLLGVATVTSGVVHPRRPTPSAPSAAPPASSPIAMAPAPSAAPESVRRVVLAVLPEDASVEIDGGPRPPRVEFPPRWAGTRAGRPAASAAQPKPSPPADEDVMRRPE